MTHLPEKAREETIRLVEGLLDSTISLSGAIQEKLNGCHVLSKAERIALIIDSAELRGFNRGIAEAAKVAEKADCGQCACEYGGYDIGKNDGIEYSEIAEAIRKLQP